MEEKWELVFVVGNGKITQRPAVGRIPWVETAADALQSEHLTLLGVQIV